LFALEFAMVIALKNSLWMEVNMSHAGVHMAHDDDSAKARAQASLGRGLKRNTAIETNARAAVTISSTTIARRELPLAAICPYMHSDR
jgi:hypothetical protein